MRVLVYADETYFHARADAVRALRDRERLVDHHAAANERVAERRKQIALQVPRDDDEVEPAARQRMLRQVRAPRAERDA